MNKNNILTAVDIDNNKKTIEKDLAENVEKYVRLLLRRTVKKIRDSLKIKYVDNPVKQIVSNTEKDKLKTEIYNSDEIKEYTKYQIDVLKSTKNNYYILRETINGLNELNEFSAEIERNLIQTIDGLLPYNRLLEHSLKKLNLYYKIVEARNKNIDKYIATYANKKLPFKNDSLELLINMRELYNIDKSYDDIDLYEKYDMQSNIDMSNKLADLCFKSYTEGNTNDNILNQLLDKTDTFISRLAKTSIIDNKLFGQLLLSSYNTDRNTSFVSNNSVTAMKTMYVNNIVNMQVYCTRTLGEILLEITNDEYIDIDKQYKQQIYMTYDGKRPGMYDYNKWNGLQVYDIDLKEWVNDYDGNIELLKKSLYNYLVDFKWFLWICKSSSGKGIHIYTKTSPPHHIFTNIEDNEYLARYWYALNYNNKLSNIYDSIYRIHHDKNINVFFANDFFNEEEDGTRFELTNKIKFVDETNKKASYKSVGVDNVVGRITAGIRVGYDKHPLVNPNFMDLHVGLNLNQTLDGFNYPNTVKKILLRDTALNKKHLKIIDEEYAIKSIDDLASASKKLSDIDLSKYVSLGLDIDTVKHLPVSSINYQTRYHVCNTLAALYGKDGLQIAHNVLESELSKNVGEINSFYSCAISNGKKPSKLGIELLKKCGIIKSVEPELKEFVDNNFKNTIKRSIENTLINKVDKCTIELSATEYLSDKQDILLNPLKGGITNEKINVVFSPPGSGKTRFILNLAKQGKRVLLVLPYISVIKNKVENDKTLMSIFECYYGAKDIKDIEYGINAVTTFDKFARSNYEKVSKMFDYIIIDESHLLFTSSYRISATSNVVKKIKDLFFISSNDPFSAKLCLMTGTETGESYFFDTVANIISVSKKSLTKTMDFLICDDLLDSITRLSDKVSTLIKEDYKIMIPTNKGEIYSEKLIGMIEYILGRPLKYGYYKRSNTDQEICRLINDCGTVGDYEVIFCSNYLSVGVDINDKHNFASIYLGNFSGYEIEQFNARIRNTGIKSLYCIQTQKSDGNTNDMLLEEPNLILRINDEDVENFTDDKAIASAKQEFLAQYDPVLHKIVTPGFSYLNGKIRFNLEEYELISFENKYNECMQHPVKVARELNKYGYEISVNTEYEGLSLDKQEELKNIGIEAAKNEKTRKHSLLIGTFLDLINKNNYINKFGLEFDDVIGWIGKNQDNIFEDRDSEIFVNIEFDLFSTPTKCTVKSREALDEMYKYAKYLISKYSVTKATDIIMQYIDDNDILRKKPFKRAINLLKLIDKSDANELAQPLVDVLDKMYDFVDQFNMNKKYRISYNTYQTIVDSWANGYIDSLGIKINTLYGFNKIKDTMVEMLSDISKKTTGKNGMRFEYNQLPDQDSAAVLNKRSVDTMIERMFRITTDVIEINNSNKNRKSRQKHIILNTQEF